MRAEDQFHLGIVVEDFEATMAEYSALLGYEWSVEAGGPVAVTLQTGDAVHDLKCAFSLTEPRLEIVRQVPGTFWEPAADGGIHHIGYWSDDVAADSAALVSHGWVNEATRTGPDGAPFFTFHRSPIGLRIELVSRIAQPGLERLWATAAPCLVAADGQKA